LFAPANARHLVHKLPASHPDAVVIDLEDGCPVELRAEARRTLGEDIERLTTAGGSQVFVRISHPGSADFSEDLAVLTPSLAGVLVPKLEGAREVASVLRCLRERGLGQLAVVGGLESAAGVADARSVAAAGLQSVYFGAEDFITDMGGRRTSGNAEVATARAWVALAARAAGIVAIDQVVTDLRDLERVRREADEAASMGYAGKMCIHPAQVGPVNTAFLPSPEQLDRSHRIVAAFEAARRRGAAVIEFEGSMIDEPLVRRARAIVAAAGIEASR
jgi:citrate lyase subunit beta/citryl-CoA lyase